MKKSSSLCFTISALTQKECQLLEHLYQENKEESGFKQLTEEYLSQNFLIASVKQTPHYDGDIYAIYNVLIAKNEKTGKILGFSVYSQSKVDDVSNNKKDIAQLAPNTPKYTGSIAAFGVDRHYHRKGIGLNLLLATVCQLIDTQYIALLPSTGEAGMFYKKYYFVADDPSDNDSDLLLYKKKYGNLISRVTQDNERHQTQVKYFVPMKQPIKKKPKLPTMLPPPIPRNNEHGFFKKKHYRQTSLKKTNNQSNDINHKNDCLIM